MDDVGCEDTLTCAFDWDAWRDAEVADGGSVSDAAAGEETSPDPATTVDGGRASVGQGPDSVSPTSDESQSEGVWSNDETHANPDAGDILRVESVTPQDQATGVSLDSVVEIVFSDEPPQSVVDAISLSHGGTAVPVDVEVNGNTVTLTPERSLGLAVEYEIAIVPGETELNLAGDLESTFATREGEWGPVISIDQGVGVSSSPSAAVLPDGTAVVLWGHVGGGVSSIYSAIRPPAGTWGEPVLVDEGTDGDADAPTVVASSAGHVYAAWHRYEEDRDYVRVAALSNHEWSTPETLSTNATCEKSPDYSTTCNARIAKASINSQGTLIVGWSQMGSSYVQPPELVSRRRDTNGVWGSLLSVGGSSDLDLALDEAGNTMATGTYRGFLQVNRLASDSSDWASAETNLTFEQSRPFAAAQVRFDGRGEAHAVWPTEAGMQAATYRADSGWSETALVGDGKTAAVVTASQNNTVLVAWISPTLSEGGISGNRYTGNKWEEPRYLAGPVTDGEPSSIGIDGDANGNGILVWTLTSESSSDIWWNRYAFDTWQTAAKLDTAAGPASNVDVAVNSNGKGIVVWQQGDSTSLIYARVFE